MELKLTNTTRDPQQIMFCDGTGVVVLPGDEKEIDLGSVYTEEIQRLSKFFKIEEKVVQPKRMQYKASEPETKTVKEEGGLE
jgi:hypothetical protein